MHCLSGDRTGQLPSWKIYFYWHLVHAVRVVQFASYGSPLDVRRIVSLLRVYSNISNPNKLAVSAI